MITKSKKPKSIAMADVKSSQVAEAGYDKDTKTLAVKFKSGGVYHYSGVEPAEHDRLMKAESFGKFLQSNIVGKYKHRKI